MLQRFIGVLFCGMMASSASFGSVPSSSRDFREDGPVVSRPTSSSIHSPDIVDTSSPSLGTSSSQGIVPSDERLILSIDGGGIRGLFPAILLSWLEEQVKAEIVAHSPVNAPEPEIRIGECFDVMAGTSTGGIITLGLNVMAHGRPLYPVQTFVDLYAKHGADVFPSSRQGFLSGVFSSKFDPAPLERLLAQYFGERTLQDVPKPLLTTTYDLNQEELFVFSSVSAKTLASENYKLKDVARSTSAAPTFLPATHVQDQEQKHNRTFVDGGVTANNPTLLGYLEAQRLYPNARFHVISMGCGTAPIFDLESKQSGGKLNWATSITGVLMNSASAMAHQLMSQMAALRGDQYTRIQFAPDQKASSLDDASEKNIRHLRGYAQREIAKLDSPIHKVKKALSDFYARHHYYVFFPLIQEIKQKVSQSERELDLSNRFLTERAFWEVSDFVTHNPYPFAKLNLSRNTLYPSLLQFLPAFKDLEELDISHTNMTVETLQALKDTPLPSLKTVNMKNNPIMKTLPAGQILFYTEPYPRVLLDDEIFYTLGQHYEGNNNFGQAVHYYEQGQDDLNQLSLANILVVPGRANAPCDIHRGLAIYETLANKNDAEAQYQLGWLYQSAQKDVLGYLIERKLIEPIQMEGAQEDELQRKIGDQLTQKAAHWYRLAADQRHKTAASKIAPLYRDSKIQAPIRAGEKKGERLQLLEALKYYQIARDAGSQSVQRHIEDLERRLSAGASSSTHS